jgi:hypothetical protein
MNKKIIITAIVLVAIAIIGVLGSGITGLTVIKQKKEYNLDAFAQCLTKQNITMYGAYWCPHCLNEKEAFGTSWQYVQYIECDAKGPNGNPDLCKQMGVEGYPTWIIDGVKMPGEMTLEKLAQLSQCSLY